MIPPDIHTEDLPDCLGENLGGIQRRIWYAPVSYFSVVITGQGTASTYEQSRAIGKKVVKLKGRKELKYIDCYLDATSVGEKNSGTGRKQKLISELKFSLRRLSANNLGFLSQMRNEALIFFVPDNNGNTWIVGDEKNAAFLSTSDANTGTKAEDDNVINLVFNANTELHLYEGTPQDIVSIGAFTLGFASGFKI